MGYTNAPAEFQKCTSFVLQDEIPHVANVFIDDLPVKGPKSTYPDEEGDPEVLEENPGIRRFIWEHAVDVHRIMHRIKDVGATFSATKIQLCLPDVLIVGQRCTPEGRLPDTEKVSKILNWPIPTTVKEARGFMGLCGTVRIWILGFSELAKPITKLWKKDEPFIWGEEQDEAFERLKERVCSAPAMRSIDYTSANPVILSVDSSFVAVGIILSQIDDEGKRRPARYGSLPMGDTESRYSQPKLELYGLYRALRHFRLHIIGVQALIVEVDAKYIKGMLNEPDLQPNATINRWIQGILLFDFTLVHVPAIRFKGPDALSRRPLADDEEIEPDEDSWLDDIALFTGISQEHYRPHSLSHYNPTYSYEPTSLPSVLGSTTSQEKNLRDIFKFLSTFEAPYFERTAQRRKFVNRATQYFVRGDQMFKRIVGRPPLLVVFDANKRVAILHNAHEELGHKGVQATFETIRYRFYWPHLYTDVKHHVQSCHECQVRSVKKMHIPITVSTPATIFVKVYVDIMKMPSAAGHKNLVLARDDLSRYVEGRALRSPSAKAMAKFFWEDLYCRYGAIGQVVTDNGPEVKGAFDQLLMRVDIPHVMISPYNSQANGVVERGHFNIREAIVKSCGKNITKWPEKVRQALFAENITTSRVTGWSPFYLLHGVHPVLPFDLTEATFMVEGFHANMDPADFLSLRIRQIERRQEDLDHAAKTLKKARFKSKAQFEHKFRLRMHRTSFHKGDLVLVRNTRIEKELNRKTKPRYLGPFVIERQTKGGSYVLREMNGVLSKRGVAAFRLVPYISRDLSLLPSLADPLEEEDETLSLSSAHVSSEEELVTGSD
jgi:transposase InsO family protein